MGNVISYLWSLSGNLTNSCHICSFKITPFEKGLQISEKAGQISKVRQKYSLKKTVYQLQRVETVKIRDRHIGLGQLLLRMRRGQRNDLATGGFA